MKIQLACDLADFRNKIQGDFFKDGIIKDFVIKVQDAGTDYYITLALNVRKRQIKKYQFTNIDTEGRDGKVFNYDPADIPSKIENTIKKYLADAETLADLEI